jgi:hypothetical protein
MSKNKICDKISNFFKLYCCCCCIVKKTSTNNIQTSTNIIIAETINTKTNSTPNNNISYTESNLKSPSLNNNDELHEVLSNSEEYLTHPMEADKIKQGNYIIIRNRPCKVIEKSSSKTVNMVMLSAISKVSIYSLEKNMKILYQALIMLMYLIS